MECFHLYYHCCTTTVLARAKGRDTQRIVHEFPDLTRSRMHITCICPLSHSMHLHAGICTRSESCPVAVGRHLVSETCGTPTAPTLQRSNPRSPRLPTRSHHPVHAASPPSQPENHTPLLTGLQASGRGLPCNA
jgi:hypothetical protein